MKNFILLLLITPLFLFSGCKKEHQPEKVKSFHISGVVLDEHGNPVDSVYVSLGYTTFASPVVPVAHMTTNNDGTFEFQYTPDYDKQNLFYVHCDKLGYSIKSQPVDLYKSEQSYEILIVQQ
ncbi:MAG TPA: carboxypeptidase-like regulatory domain-containing protein [Lentimicrobium sp.]|nr:carboxypeptidase-like regulatory domain-containing protein [Lentimicrobium sp.]